MNWCKRHLKGSNTMWISYFPGLIKKNRSWLVKTWFLLSIVVVLEEKKWQRIGYICSFICLHSMYGIHFSVFTSWNLLIYFRLCSCPSCMIFSLIVCRQYVCCLYIFHYECIMVVLTNVCIVIWFLLSWFHLYVYNIYTWYYIIFIGDFTNLNIIKVLFTSFSHQTAH